MSSIAQCLWQKLNTLLRYNFQLLLQISELLEAIGGFVHSSGWREWHPTYKKL